LLILGNWLYEIKHLQKSVAHLIPRASFTRLIKDIAQGYKGDIKFQSVALAVLQECGETMLTMFFEMLNHAALHAKRVTVMPKDVRLCKSIVGIWTPENWFGASPGKRVGWDKGEEVQQLPISRLERKKMSVGKYSIVKRRGKVGRKTVE